MSKQRYWLRQLQNIIHSALCWNWILNCLKFVFFQNSKYNIWGLKFLLEQHLECCTVYTSRFFPPLLTNLALCIVPVCFDFDLLNIEISEWNFKYNRIFCFCFRSGAMVLWTASGASCIHPSWMPFPSKESSCECHVISVFYGIFYIFLLELVRF